MSDILLSDYIFPEAWVVKLLRDFSEERPSTLNPSDYPEETFEYYSIPAYQEGQRPIPTKGMEIGSAKLLLKPGTVIFGKLNPRVEKVWQVGDYTSFRKIGSTEWLPIVPRADVDELFLYFLLLSEHVMPKAKTLVSGSTPSRQRVDPSSFYRIQVPLPPLSEQRDIARILARVHRAIEQQDRVVELTVELRNALLEKFFAEGFHGERRRETEIGMMPSSWEIKRVADVISEDPKNGLYKHSSTYGSGTMILRIDDFGNDGDVVNSASNRVHADENERRTYALRKDDIVFNRVNSLTHLGKTALVGDLDEPLIFESNMMRFRVDERSVFPRFALRLLNSQVCKQQVIASAKRAVAQSSINQGNLKAMVIPLPSLNAQSELLEATEAIICKIDRAKSKRDVLGELFRGLLHQLMTAKIRVHDLDLAELESAVAA